MDIMDMMKREVEKKWKASRTKAQAAHALLLAEGERRGLPQFFRKDLLVHDLAALTELEAQLDRFSWVLRTSGTHLFPGHLSVAGMKSLSSQDEETHFFHGTFDVATGEFSLMEVTE